MPRANLPVMSELNNRTRVSPYLLRSNRSQKQQEVLSDFADPSEWEEVKCVICMEPPHNAVLLHCASLNCRPYMCDTNPLHSSCFRQFRKTYMKGSLSKTLNCPYCRGEVFDATKVPRCGIKIMNAKPRSCSVKDCEFSGTYAKLEKHMKTEHQSLFLPKIDWQTEWNWDHMTIEAEYNELMSAIESIHGSLQNLGDITNMANTLLPILEIPTSNSFFDNWFI